MADVDNLLGKLRRIHHNAIVPMSNKKSGDCLPLPESFFRQCEPYGLGKFLKSQIPSTTNKRDCAILERVHSEGCEPIELTS